MDLNRLTSHLLPIEKAFQYHENATVITRTKTVTMHLATSLLVAAVVVVVVVVVVSYSSLFVRSLNGYEVGLSKKNCRTEKPQ